MGSVKKLLYRISIGLILFASVVVCTFHYHLFAISKTDSSRLLEDLRSNVLCQACSLGKLEACQKCPRKIRKVKNDLMPVDTKECLLQQVQSKTSHVKFWKEGIDALNNVSFDVKYLAKFVPLPSARWFLSKSVHGNDLTAVVLKDWRKGMGNPFSYSFHGIKEDKEKKGRMTIPITGWYFLYIQMDFHCFKKHDSSSRIQISVTTTTENSNAARKSLVEIEEKPQKFPAHSFSKSQSRTNCLTAQRKALVKLHQHDALVVSAVFPKTVAINPNPSYSYFGVHMIKTDCKSSDSYCYPSAETL